MLRLAAAAASRRPWPTRTAPPPARLFSTQTAAGASTRRQLAASGVTAAVLLTGGLVAVSSWWREGRKPVRLDAPAANHQGQHSAAKLFTRAEVGQHRTLATGVWVTMGDGVYDITSFVRQHPGGDKILLAAGGPVEPFWSVYTIHQTPAVRQVLEQYRVGQLDPSEPTKDSAAPVDVEDPFAGDPVRSPVLTVRSHKPFNAETPLAMLGDNFLTPTDIFYKRNHLPVPTVDEGKFRLEVQRPDGGFQSLSLADLRGDIVDTVQPQQQPRQFPAHTITATLQCAGNRRQELAKVAPVQGLAWSAGAIGNAEWTGVWLRDVLRAAGWRPEQLLSQSTEDAAAPRHVVLDGLDGYGASVPLHKALAADGDVLLAYAMNGQPLPRDHGFPLRCIVPGHTGARSVKWLSRIAVSRDESHSHWQQLDYKGFSPSSNWDHVDYSRCGAIQEMPVQSAILEPGRDSLVDSDVDSLTVRGYAWSGGGHGIERVDVSADGGATWHTAELVKRPDQQPAHKVWAWCLWEAELPIQEGAKSVELVCKAVDTAYNCQPETSTGIYNRRGVLSTAWDRFTLPRRRDES